MLLQWFIAPRITINGKMENNAQLIVLMRIYNEWDEVTSQPGDFSMISAADK